MSAADSADDRSTSRPGARRPSTLQGLGEAEAPDEGAGQDDTPNQDDAATHGDAAAGDAAAHGDAATHGDTASRAEAESRPPAAPEPERSGPVHTDSAVTTPPPAAEREMQVRSLAELAAESHLAMSASARDPLPEPNRAEDAPSSPPASAPSGSGRSRTEPAKKKSKKKKPEPLTLGPAKRAAHNFDSVRRPTRGHEERVESASTRRSRRRKKPSAKKRAQPNGGVIEEVGPAVRQPQAERKDATDPAVRRRLDRLSHGELKKASERPADATTTARGDATVPVDLSVEAAAQAPRREREDEKTRRHVYGDRELASAKPTGKSGPDHPRVSQEDAPGSAKPPGGNPSDDLASAQWQPGVVSASAARRSADDRTTGSHGTTGSARSSRGARTSSAAPALRSDDDTPILASHAPPSSLPGAPATPSQPVPRAASGVGRWLPVFLASALGAFIAVALYWTAFDAGASSRVAVVPTTPPPTTPTPAAAPPPPAPPVAAPEPEPVEEEPAVAEEEQGPLDLGDIPAPIAALSTLERQQLAQDLRIRARALNRTHQYRRSEQVWRVSLQHDPASAAAAHGLAETLLATERPEPAMEWARRATELETEDASHEELLGDALIALEELEGAMVAYRRALELNPDSRGARIRLSRVRRRLSAEP
ncbi:MAG: hypothetical protein AB8I08_24250 [Sandaracinaceae bacterium]